MPKLDLVSLIIDFESGSIDVDDAIALFCELGNSGKINHLQGFYGRSFKRLLDREIIIRDPAGQYVRNPESNLD